MKEEQKFESYYLEQIFSMLDTFIKGIDSYKDYQKVSSNDQLLALQKIEESIPKLDRIKKQLIADQFDPVKKKIVFGL